VSPAALVLWIALVALLVVLALAGRAAARALRELKRASARVEDYAELPVVKAAERAQADAVRIETALGEVPSLLARTRVAAGTICRGPIPPGVVTAFLVLRREVAAFRRFARR
jgi:hypothetical protein